MSAKKLHVCLVRPNQEDPGENVKKSSQETWSCKRNENVSWSHISSNNLLHLGKVNLPQVCLKVEVAQGVGFPNSDCEWNC